MSSLSSLLIGNCLCLFFQATPNDGLPPIVCIKCREQLDSCHRFRRAAHQTHQALVDYLEFTSKLNGTPQVSFSQFYLYFGKASLSQITRAIDWKNNILPPRFMRALCLLLKTQTYLLCNSNVTCLAELRTQSANMCTPECDAWHLSMGRTEGGKKGKMLDWIRGFQLSERNLKFFKSSFNFIRIILTYSNVKNCPTPQTPL